MKPKKGKKRNFEDEFPDVSKEHPRTDLSALPEILEGIERLKTKTTKSNRKTTTKCLSHFFSIVSNFLFRLLKLKVQERFGLPLKIEQIQ